MKSLVLSDEGAEILRKTLRTVVESRVRDADTPSQSDDSEASLELDTLQCILFYLGEEKA